MRKLYPDFTLQTWAGIPWGDDPTFNARYQRIVEGLRSGLAGGRGEKGLTTPSAPSDHCDTANFAPGGKAYFGSAMERRPSRGALRALGSAPTIRQRQRHKGEESVTNVLIEPSRLLRGKGAVDELNSRSRSQVAACDSGSFY